MTAPPDGTDALCLALYGRPARMTDCLGGAQAAMLHDAARFIRGAKTRQKAGVDAAPRDGEFRPGDMTPEDRDALGRVVREAWTIWAKNQPDPKPSWLVPYDLLPETDREADRRIGEAVAEFLANRRKT